MWTIAKIVDLSYDIIRSLPKKELYNIAKYAERQANRRLETYEKRIEKKNDVYARTIENFKVNKHGKFSGPMNITKDMNRNDLISEITRSRKLFSSESGTLTGAMKVQREQKERLLSYYKDDSKTFRKIKKELNAWDNTEWSEYWRLYQRFMDEQGGKQGTLYSSREVQEKLLEVLSEDNTDGMNIIELVRQKLGWITENTYIGE